MMIERKVSKLVDELQNDFKWYGTEISESIQGFITGHVSYVMYTNRLEFLIYLDLRDRYDIPDEFEMDGRALPTVKLYETLNAEELYLNDYDVPMIISFLEGRVKEELQKLVVAVDGTQT